MFIKLCDCKIAEYYIIDHITGFNKCRLLEMGFVRNKNIKIIMRLFKKGPYLILLDKNLISLRVCECENIFVREK